MLGMEKMLEAITGMSQDEMKAMAIQGGRVLRTIEERLSRIEEKQDKILSFYNDKNTDPELIEDKSNATRN